MKWLRAMQSNLCWPIIEVPSVERPISLHFRLMWMMGIWAASVSVLLLIAYVLRWVIAR